MKAIILISFLFQCLGCSYIKENQEHTDYFENGNEKGNLTSNDSLNNLTNSIKDDSVVEHQPKNLVGSKADKIEPIIEIKTVKLMSFEKELWPPGSLTFYEKGIKECKPWNLTKTQITDILVNTREIQYTVIHHVMAEYPCSYKCKVLLNNRISADIDINPGSWMSVSLPDTVSYLLYTGPKDYFLQYEDGDERNR